MDKGLSLAPLCRAIDYQFSDFSVLKTALTHKSASKTSGGCLAYHNERLEFLGDAVLSLVAAEYLYSNNHHFNEGELSRLRAQFVCQENLSQGAKKIELGKYIVTDKAMRASGSNNSPAVLADTLEALIGAVFMDKGLLEARQVIFSILGEPSLTLVECHKDAKTLLQELVQARLGQSPKYELLEKKGPAHAPTFVIGVKIDGMLKASAEGESKKVAGQNAAQVALKLFDNAQS
ncbi:MAG TPA: ribonuclease III [Myxococcota bacterium]|nr:ribonuclease III [Myxococcota bacterium]